MIKFHGVTKAFQHDVVAIDNIDLHIRKGEFVYLVGPSGAGKSTLLKLIYREERPDQGQIFIDGEDITYIHPADIPLLRRDVGVVFQDFKLLPDRTVYENIAFTLRVIDTTPRAIANRVPELLQLVGLQDRANHFPNQLSGGEQQRCALARAIASTPLIIIADEPTGNLDPETSMEIVRLLGDINRMGATVVMATHDKAVVNALPRRVVEMRSGQVTRDDASGRYEYAG